MDFEITQEGLESFYPGKIVYLEDGKIIITDPETFETTEESLESLKQRYKQEESIPEDEAVDI